MVIVSKAKWDKTRCLINELRDMMDTAVSAPDQNSEGAKLFVESDLPDSTKIKFR